MRNGTPANCPVCSSVGVHGTSATTALMRGFTAAARSRASVSNSADETSLSATSPARPVAS